MTVVVDHNGSCMGYNFTAGEPVDLPEEVVAALGDSASPADKANAKNKAQKNSKKTVMTEEEVSNKEI